MGALGIPQCWNVNILTERTHTEVLRYQIIMGKYLQIRAHCPSLNHCLVQMPDSNPGLGHWLQARYQLSHRTPHRDRRKCCSIYPCYHSITQVKIEWWGAGIVPGVIVTKLSPSVIFSQVRFSHNYATQSTTSVIFLPTQLSHICRDDSDSSYNIAINEQTINQYYHVHTHTHNRFTAGLEYVRVHPGQQVPER